MNTSLIFSLLGVGTASIIFMVTLLKTYYKIRAEQELKKIASNIIFQYKKDNEVDWEKLDSFANSLKSMSLEKKDLDFHLKEHNLSHEDIEYIQNFIEEKLVNNLISQYQKEINEGLNQTNSIGQVRYLQKLAASIF